MKRIIKLFTILAVMFMMSVPLSTSADTALIVDETGELAPERLEICQQQLQMVSDKYDVDVIAVIAADTDGKDIVDFADDYFDYNGYGRGAGRSGIIMVIDMNGREMYLSTRGKCIDYFTDYGLETIADEVYVFLPGNIEVAVAKYVELCDRYINAAITDKPIDFYYNRLYIHLNDEKGNPLNGHFSVYDANGDYITMIYVDRGEGYVGTEDTNAVYVIKCDNITDKYNRPADVTVRGSEEYDISMVAERAPYDLLTGGAVSSSSGILAALIGCSIMKAKNRSVHSKYEADRYVERGSFNLTNYHDHYMYSKTSRTARPRETHSSGSSGGGGHGGSFSGGSSTHTSSSGATHGGGGRRGF